MQPRDTTSAAFGNEDRARALHSLEMMVFDPDKHAVTFFIPQFHDIAEIDKERAVSRMLPMCLAEGRAMEWHNGLSKAVRQVINHQR